MGLGAVLASIGVVAAKNPVMSVLSLLGSFFCLAVIYLLAGFQFMAAAQLLVYAGAIMVLFLFVVMLLNLGSVQGRWLERSLLKSRALPVTLAIAAGVFLLSYVAIQQQGKALEFEPALAEKGVDSVSGIAELLFSRHLLPFEVSSVLLLAAAIAVMVLAKRERPGQAPADPEEGAAS